MFKRAYVEITNVCNLRCSFCPGTRRAHRRLTAEEFRILAEKLRGHTSYLYLHVLGEPLLHPELAQILAIAAELGFRVCITTNGTLIPERLDILREAKALHKVSISLHSFEGNDCPGDLKDYIASCARAAAELSERGVICALRLWNEGGQEEKNGEILDILTETLGRDVRASEKDRRGNLRLADRLFLENASKFEWPDLQAQEGGVEFCHGLRQ